VPSTFNKIDEDTMTGFNKATIVLLLIFMGACSSTPSLKDAPMSKLQLNLEEFFLGKTTAHGQFQDRFGKVSRRFTVAIQGAWDGEILTLSEDFIYEDDSTEQRVWTLRKASENTWVGTAKGVDGMAYGEERGDTFNWKYSFNLPTESGTVLVNFDDWMWLMDDKHLLNRAYMSKYGLRIGEVIIVFKK
jgi:hypothetical protein